MKNYYILLGIVHVLTSLNAVLAIPTDLNLSFFVNTEKPCFQKSNREPFLENILFNPCHTKVKRQINGGNSAVVQVYEMKITTNINNKFADTVVTAKVVNTAVGAEQKIFTVVLPNDAFVVGFIMEIGGKNYTSFVVENDEARKQFDSALADGVIAGYVAPSARDSNAFTISVIVEPNVEIGFNLHYQEFLKRTHGRYESVINIHPGQPVPDLRVEVYINETQKLKDVEVLPLRTGNEISKGSADLDPKADIVWTSNSSAVITFSPNIERQKNFARLLNTPENNGLAAQFVVQFDVERELNGGEVLFKNGFYVNFFAPSGLESIPKHIVFLLDTSGSMLGNKMKQLKEAMGNILDQLHEKDLFHLVEFSNGAKVWNLDNSNNNVLHFSGNFRPRGMNSNSNFPNAYLANPKYIAAAKNGVNQFVAKGGTDALSALNVGLQLIETAKQNKIDNAYRQAVIVFLTDGLPNTRPDTVVKTITELNTGLKKSAIYSLSFGDDGNRDFLEKLSGENNGTTKHIYDSSDSAKQLEKFYDEISSPILLNVSINYDPSQCEQMTQTHFPVLYEGSEIVVAARCEDLNDVYQPEISATSSNGVVRMKPVVKNSLTDISRLWAYLTVKELLDKKKMSNANTNEIDKEIVGLSLNYSFVTDLSPMVVRSPQKDLVVGNLELQNTLGPNSYPKAVSPDPNYVSPTSAATTTTTTETPTTTTTETPTTTTTETPTTTTTKSPTTTAIPAINDDRIKELFYALRRLKQLLNEHELFYNKVLFQLDGDSV